MLTNSEIVRHAHRIGQTIHTHFFPKFEGFEDLFTFNTVVIKHYNMSPWITFEVYGLHNGYIRDECPKNFQWLGNYLATVFNRLDLIPADGYCCTKC